MNLIDRDELDIDVSESWIFSALIDFKEGRATYDETSRRICDEFENAVKEALSKAPVLMDYAEYVLAKEMLNSLAKRLHEKLIGVSDSITSK